MYVDFEVYGSFLGERFHSKIRTYKTSKIKNKKLEKIHETKSCSFEKINEVNKPLARLAKNKRLQNLIQIVKIKKWKWGHY